MLSRLQQISVFLAFGCALTVMFGMTISSSLHAESLKMTVLLPEQTPRSFWSESIAFMNAVAEDLGIDLDMVASQATSTYAIKKDGLSITNRNNPPDYILTGYWNSAIEQVMESAQNKGIRVFFFNAPVDERDKPKIQQPRQRFKNWIGQMSPDETTAGYELACALLEHATKLTTNTGSKAIQIAGLAGENLSTVSITRETGLRRAVHEKGAVLNTVIGTSWQRDNAAKATTQILKQYPDTTVIWAVSDGLALGAIDLLKQKNMQPGIDMLVGGFDWSTEAIQAIRKSDMAASMGGHFMEGGRAMILAFDYEHGEDFAAELGTTILTRMRIMDQSNVEEYAKKLGDRNWEKVDFRKFSKFYNKELKHYDFSLKNLLHQLRD